MWQYSLEQFSTEPQAAAVKRFYIYIHIYIHFQDLFVSLVMFKYDLKILKLITHCEKSVLLA